MAARLAACQGLLRGSVVCSHALRSHRIYQKRRFRYHFAETMNAALLILLVALSAAAQEIPRQYNSLCAGCHGDRATGTERGPALADSRSLRGRSLKAIVDVIRNGTQGGMPAVASPDEGLTTLAAGVHSVNASAFDVPPRGDVG